MINKINVNGKKVSFVINIRNKESQIITILVEDEVKDDYLAYLQSIGVSYIFAEKIILIYKLL